MAFKNPSGNTETTICTAGEGINKIRGARDAYIDEIESGDGQDDAKGPQVGPQVRPHDRGDEDGRQAEWIPVMVVNYDNEEKDNAYLASRPF